jgi:signal transduction histidine kinase
VADSSKANAKENLAAYENMKVNLLANRLVPEKVPLVLQYNKRDLDDIQTEAEMNRALNPWSRRSFAAVAPEGQGVMETFVAIVQEMLAAIAVKYNLKEKGLDPATVPEVVAQAFSSLLKEADLSGPLPENEPAARVVLSQSTNADHGSPLQATPETGLVSEELLHRALRSNVELAEALAGLVRDVNLGLGAILSHAELLSVYRDDEKRQAAIAAIQQEAGRVRKIMQDLGRAGGEPSASPPPRAPEPSAPPPPPPPPTPTRPPPRAPVAPGEGLDALLRQAIAASRPTVEPRGVSVELRIPPGTLPPRCPPESLQRAVALLLDGVSVVAPSGSTAVLRSERKPVLLRAKDGQQVKRDFVMLAVTHGGELGPDEQQRILQGGDHGPLGESCRLVRDLGGFVRFAPLPGGGLETRLFLPAV